LAETIKCTEFAVKQIFTFHNAYSFIICGNYLASNNDLPNFYALNFIYITAESFR